MTDRLKKGYLQWRCRRGTKELDVILNRFLDDSYQDLTDEELLLFDELLNTQDTQLWYWLSLQETAENNPLEKIIKKITQND